MSHTKNGSKWMAADPDMSAGSLAFHAIEAGKFIVGTKGSNCCHCGKDGYLLIYSYYGEGEILYCGQSVSMPAGTITLIDCQKSYKVIPKHDAKDDWVYYWLRFNGSGGTYYYNSIFPEEYTAFNVDTPEIKDEFENILSDFSEPAIGGCFRISHGITTLLTYMIELRYSGSNKMYKHQQTIKRATQYIRDNYNLSLDIDQLAKRANLSKYYFIKLFKEFMHVTPYEYVINYRINEAKKYIRMTQCKVSQISDHVGFNDECNFIRTFKRVTGMTPLQYRDKERK